jgi:hypothetical protein
MSERGKQHFDNSLKEIESAYYQLKKERNSNKNNEITAMAISKCFFSPTSENPHGFSVWCVLAKLSAKPRNYS